MAMVMMCEKEKEKEKKQEWDNSLASLQQLQAKDRCRHMAAMRRERALAYAFSEQLRRCIVKPKKVEVFDGPRSGTMDNNGSHWGWRWLERWMAAKPWESSFPDISRQHASVLVNVREHNMDAQLVKSIECTPTSSSKFVKKRSLSMPETMFDDYSNVGSAMASKRPKSMTHGLSNANNTHANRPGYMQSTQSTKAKEVKARAHNVQQRR